MKIKPGYILREVMDIFVVIGVGSEAYMPNQILSLNETGAAMWNILKEDAEKKDLIKTLIRDFEVDEETASKDVDSFLAQLREKELIEE